MDIKFEDIWSLLETINPLLFWNLVVILVCGTVGVLFLLRYKKTGSRQLLNSLPGICTSMGIFCTFCSICISLQGLDSSNMDLPRIVNNLIPAFSTSIYGIIFALIATIYSKLEYAKKDHEAESIQNTPDENLYTMATTMVDMARNLKNMPSDVRDMKGYLSHLETTVSEQERQTRELKERLDENLTQQTEALRNFISGFIDRMDSIFDRMSVSIERNIQTFGEDQFQKSSQVVEGITLKLQEVSQGLLNAQTESVSSMVENTQATLLAISSTVEQLVGQMSTSNTAALENLKNAQAEELQKIVQSQKDQIDSMAEHNRHWAEQTNAAWQTQYEAISSHNAESLQQMIDLKAAYEELGKKLLDETSQANRDTIAALQNSVSQFSNDIHTSVETQCNELASAISGNVSMLRDSYQYIDTHLAQIKSDYEQATLAFRDAVQNAHDINESFEHTIESVDTSLKAVHTTNTNIETVLNILQEKQTNINALVQKIKEMSEVLDSIQQLESVLNKIARK